MTEPRDIPRRAQASSSSSSSASASPSSSSSSLSSVEEGRGRERVGKRASLLSSSLSTQTHTVINVGHPDGPPRLITCVRSSQGFDWNQEIFLPSHHSHSSHVQSSPALERKKDPVHEIVLSDEEVRSMFPE